MSTLIVGEKPSVSRAISAVVGANKSNQGYNEGNGYIVSWCVGHLVDLMFPDDYGNGWNGRWSFSQLPMIPEQWQFRITENTKAQFRILKNLMNRSDVTEIICATDADREGECIFRYVYNIAGCRKSVKRLWVSSLEESAIRAALSNMKPMSAYDNLYHAGYSRAKADWLVGMNGSRLFSCRYGGRLNIGRVQTPTLAMVVQRDAEVNGFVKQKYFTTDLNCGDFMLSSARIDDESAVDQLVAACDGAKVTISSVRMCNYGFTENSDYFTVFKNVYCEDGREMPQRQVDHYLTIDMAKELCMIQRTEIGKRCREYFLNLEKQWNTPEAVMARALQLADQKLELVKQQNGQLTETSIDQAKQIEKMKSKADYYDNVLNSEGLLPINTIAKDYGKSAIWLNKWLHEHGIQYKQGAVWHLYQQYAGMGYVSSRTYTVYDSNGNSISKARTYWTQRGRLFIYEQLKKHGILPLVEQNDG